MIQARRRFLTTTALVAAAAMFRVTRAFPAEGALETTTVRLAKFPGSICVA
jgi:hypothetical protein